MKNMFIFLIFIAICAIAYHDLTDGTIHMIRSQTTDKQTNELPYREVTVQRGDTLLSIIEREINGQLPVPIDKLIADFQALNPHVNAHSLQIGKTYRIPQYKRK
ncbi:Tfp pilus assembly protein FimV [Anoxybacillus tengchongensis]|uniref:Tfp pilus assembly protein FimV n=1 Tax=Anoxybacillus tengchongensis TaxID=576944 RepID=A0A7W9YNF3_9BACL|nr:LisM domain containing protein [Anoxybacillus tengchongensis]MBB6175282.1 Tfp pilus assembly protein FimV [Anoxybacillus tengchongensis]